MTDNNHNEAAQSALTTFSAAIKDRAETAERNKLVAAQLEASKGVLLRYMLANKVKALPDGRGGFVVLKKKVSRPTINTEFIALALMSFAREHAWTHIEEKIADKFAEFVVAQQTRLATSEWDVAHSKTQPIATLF